MFSGGSGIYFGVLFPAPRAWPSGATANTLPKLGPLSPSSGHERQGPELVSNTSSCHAGTEAWRWRDERISMTTR